MGATATMMTTSCPGCRSPVRYAEAIAGREVRCRACGGVFNLPRRGGTPPPPAVPPAGKSPAPAVAVGPPPLPPALPPPGRLAWAKRSEVRIAAIVLLALALVVVLGRVLVRFTRPATMADRVAAIGQPGTDRTAALDALDQALCETMDPAEQRAGLAGLIALLKDPDVAIRRDAARRLLGLAKGTTGGGTRRNDQRRALKETVQRVRSDAALAPALAAARDDEDVLVRRRIAGFLGQPTPRDVSFYVCPDARATDAGGVTAPAAPGGADQKGIEEALRMVGYTVVDREAAADIVAEFTPDPTRASTDSCALRLWDRGRGTLLALTDVDASEEASGRPSTEANDWWIERSGRRRGLHDWWIERRGGQLQILLYDDSAVTSLDIAPLTSGGGGGARVYIEPNDWASFAGLRILNALRSSGVEVVRRPSDARAVVRLNLTSEQYGTYEFGGGAYRYTFDVSVMIGSSTFFHETLTATDPATLIYRNDGGPTPKRGSELLEDQIRLREPAIVDAARVAGRR